MYFFDLFDELKIGKRVNLDLSLAWVVVGCGFVFFIGEGFLVMLGWEMGFGFEVKVRFLVVLFLNLVFGYFF